MNDISITKILPDDLFEFFNSEMFENLTNIPISVNRIQSYLNNPHKNINLPVLYLIYNNNEVIAYRSVLQDELNYENSTKSTFAWLSGTWTHPEHRRKGYSKIILNEILNDYNHQVIVTNYGKEAKQLLINQKEFTTFYLLKGHRLYFKLNLSEILPPKSVLFRRTKPIWLLIDKLFNPFIDVVSQFSKKVNSKLIPIKWDLETIQFIENSQMLFKRNCIDIQWIISFPWLYQRNEKSTLDQRYHFSTACKVFENNIFEYRNHHNIVLGFLFYTVRDQTLKIHYAITDQKIVYEEFAKHIKNEILDKKISTLILTNPELSTFLKKQKKPIYSKKWNKGYISTIKFKENMKSSKFDLNLGDGDSIFI